jgi:hypothetical protein
MNNGYAIPCNRFSNSECSLDISQKDSLEEAGCLFHNNYGRGLLHREGYHHSKLMN